MSVIGQAKQEILAELPAIVRDVVRTELVALGVVHDTREPARAEPGPEPARAELRPEPDTEREPAGVEGYDPANFTVGEVLAHLEDLDDAERERVLDDERAGRNRAGIFKG